MQQAFWETVKNQAKENGHDAIIYRNEIEGGKEADSYIPLGDLKTQVTPRFEPRLISSVPYGRQRMEYSLANEKVPTIEIGGRLHALDARNNKWVDVESASLPQLETFLKHSKLPPGAPPQQVPQTEPPPQPLMEQLRRALLGY